MKLVANLRLRRWCQVVIAGIALLLPAGNVTAEDSLREMLDAPLLFVKRPSYQGIHIYDTYYKWRPGGGIYVIENPSDTPAAHRVRPIIDPNTAETLGEGIYSEPDLSWDAARLLFCFKGKRTGRPPFTRSVSTGRACDA